MENCLMWIYTLTQDNGDGPVGITETRKLITEYDENENRVNSILFKCVYILICEYIRKKS